MSDRSPEPIGVILAGGRGRRLGGDKAMAVLGGRPLIAYPLGAMRAALAEVAIVAKRTTALPEVENVARWLEPDEPQHPLVGIVHALRRAGGRSVLVCAADLPFITVAALTELAFADAAGAPAVLASAPGGDPQPLLGRYEPSAAGLLERAAAEGRAPVRATVGALGPRVVILSAPRLLFNVNSPEDLRRAEAMLAGDELAGDQAAGDQPNVKS